MALGEEGVHIRNLIQSPWNKTITLDHKFYLGYCTGSYANITKLKCALFITISKVGALVGVCEDI